MPDVFDSLRAALAHYAAGRHKEAEDIYRAVLAAPPGQPQALNLYGVLCTGTGRLDEAVDLLTRAAAADPEDSSTRFNLATALHRKGDLTAALQRYREVIAMRPAYPE